MTTALIHLHCLWQALPARVKISKILVGNFDKKPLRIDTDEFREMIPGYDGSNAYIFQSAATVAVQKILDRTFEKGIPFILDGTFAYANSLMNIKRAIRHSYAVEIIFVYQRPEIAWDFTKKREARDGRRVPRDVFIDSYIASKENIKMVKKEFGNDVIVSLVIKDITAQNERVFYDITGVEEYLEKNYNKDELKGLLS